MPPNSQSNANIQPSWWEPVQKFLDNKLINFGIPGIFIGIAADHARNERWRFFWIFLGLSGLMWLILRIGSKVLPYFDQFLDWIIGTQIPKGWTRLTDRCGTDYLDRLKAQCREYEGRGFSGEGLDLERVYVPLGLNSNEPINNPQDPIPLEQDLTTATGVSESNRVATTPLDTTIGALLQGITQKKSAWRRIVILGAPGSGKTTLLRHIALVYSLRKQSRLSRRLPHKIPVLLRLRDLTAFILKDVPAGEVPKTDLAAVIAHASKDTKFSQEMVTQLQQWFEKRLDSGQCLVMIDGLDEVADDTQRKQISAWVYSQLEQYKHQLPFILTSRPQAYQKAPLRDTSSYFVQSFSTDQRNDFLYNWYFNLEKRRNTKEKSRSKLDRIAEAKVSELVRQIEAVPSLRLMGECSEFCVRAKCQMEKRSGNRIAK